ncbi:MAG TPA: hypothetical protein VF636_08445 [Sphingomonas sp.]|jgi:hypothetical protein
MDYLSRFSPVRAIRDLRRFLGTRQPYELGFLVLSMVVTLTLIWAFMRDSYAEPVYRPDIIYVEQYRLDRTDAEIMAQQKVDQAAKEKRLAERAKRQAERQAAFKRLDDRLESYGF